MKHKTALAIALLVSSSAAQAGFYTGNELLDTPENFQLGYVAAVNDSAWAVGLVSEGKYTFCKPRGVQLGQVKDVVLKWLRENPAERHRGADSLVIAALNAAWPCPGNPVNYNQGELK